MIIFSKRSSQIRLPFFKINIQQQLYSSRTVLIIFFYNDSILIIYVDMHIVINGLHFGSFNLGESS